jgi:hypothetical protein
MRLHILMTLPKQQRICANKVKNQFTAIDLLFEVEQIEFINARAQSAQISDIKV